MIPDINERLVEVRRSIQKQPEWLRAMLSKYFRTRLDAEEPKP